MTYHPAVFYMKTNDVINLLGGSNTKSKEEPRWTTTATDLLLCGSLAICLVCQPINCFLFTFKDLINHSVLSSHCFHLTCFRCVESYSAQCHAPRTPRMTVGWRPRTRPGRSSRMVRAPWRRSGTTRGSRSSPPPRSTRTSPSPADSPATGWWCSHLSPADIPTRPTLTDARKRNAKAGINKNFSL